MLEENPVQREYDQRVTNSEMRSPARQGGPLTAPIPAGLESGGGERRPSLHPEERGGIGAQGGVNRVSKSHQ